MTDALVLQGVSKVYEVGGVELTALHEVDLTVAQEEVVTLLGPSGSGKTTLLSIAGGLLSATTGHVIVGGKDITRARSRKLTAFRRRRVGFIFQAVNLVPFLTARENLLVMAELARRDRSAAGQRADRLLEELGLGHRMNNLPSQLSGGERQRVAIGRALMNQPALVLVDEPTSALDGDLGQQVMELIVSEVKNRGAAAVIVTHDGRMVRYGDRILNMADGRIAGMSPRPEWTLDRGPGGERFDDPTEVEQPMAQPSAAAFRSVAAGEGRAPGRGAGAGGVASGGAVSGRVGGPTGFGDLGPGAGRPAAASAKGPRTRPLDDLYASLAPDYDDEEPYEPYTEPHAQPTAGPLGEPPYAPTTGPVPAASSGPPPLSASVPRTDTGAVNGLGGLNGLTQRPTGPVPQLGSVDKAVSPFVPTPEPPPPRPAEPPAPAARSGGHRRQGPGGPVGPSTGSVPVMPTPDRVWRRPATMPPVNRTSDHAAIDPSLDLSLDPDPTFEAPVEPPYEPPPAERPPARRPPPLRQFPPITAPPAAGSDPDYIPGDEWPFSGPPSTGGRSPRPPGRGGQTGQWPVTRPPTPSPPPTRPSAPSKRSLAGWPEEGWPEPQHDESPLGPSPDPYAELAPDHDPGPPRAPRSSRPSEYPSGMQYEAQPSHQPSSDPYAELAPDATVEDHPSESDRARWLSQLTPPPTRANPRPVTGSHRPIWPDRLEGQRDDPDDEGYDDFDF